MKEHSRALLGVSALVVVALLVSLCVAAYRKDLPWQGAATVTLSSTTPGLELNPLSDVKLQGRRVGEVRRITTDGTTAVIELALDKDALALIPANVDAAIVPKTLFGEKYVDLRRPAKPSPQHLRDGGVIEQSTTSVEIGQLFSRLVPVLRALRPDQLSTVLGSLARGLSGRGDDLGRAFDQLTGFLRQVDPQLDTFAHDLRQLATTSDIYARSAPDLLRIMSASSGISSELLVPEEKRFAALLDSAIGTADSTEAVIAENSRNLIRLSGRSRAVLALLDEYSSALPCFLEALHRGDILVNQVVGARGPFTNLTVDALVHQAPYTAKDDLPTNPKSDAHNSNLPDFVPSWKPHCAQFPDYVTSLKNAEPYSLSLPAPVELGPQNRAAAPDAAVDEARLALARTIAAQALGVDQDEVPAYVPLLLAPIVADGEVVLP